MDDTLGGSSAAEPQAHPQPTAGAAPRKRRRPALSCAECRRRKIKCDRNIPCRQCTLSKSATCTYSPEKLASAAASSSRAGVSLVSQDGISGVNIDASITDPSFLGMNHMSEFVTPATPASSSQSGSLPDANVVQTLVDRVQKLEQMLAATTLDGRATSGGCRTKIPAKKNMDKNHFHKTRFYGQSHWSHPFEQARKVICFEYLDNGSGAFKLQDLAGTGEINRLVDKCKVIARTIKAANAPQWPPYIVNLHETMPPRQLSDQILHLYFRTNESTSRILHIPSFWKEYEEFWASPSSDNPAMLFKILLPMAIGLSYYQGPDEHELRNKAHQWAYAAQSWLAMPNEKTRLNIPGLQIQCLLIICRSLYNIGGDLVWNTVGFIIRAAINMGLHRDPKYFPRISVLQAELRRRLWATILELNIITSLDAGMSPMISFDDFDTEPPSNIDDDEIDESTTEPPPSKPDTIFTQTSIQRAVFRSAEVRLESTSILNDFRFEQSYEDVLRLSGELMKSYKENHKLLSYFQSSVTPLDRKLLDLTTQRFLLAIHRQFAMKARSDPKYYYSRKIYIDSALAVLAHPDPSASASPVPHETQLQDDYHRMRVLSAGFLKEVLVHAGLVVYIELVVPLEDQDPDTTLFSAPSPDRKHSREPYRRLLEDLIEITRQRIALGGETNVKGHLFMSVAMGHVKAMEEGRPSEEGILEAARKSVNTCYELLRARLPSTPDMTQENLDFVGTNGEGLVFDMPDVDFAMGGEGWGMDFDNIPEAWMLSGWDDGASGMRPTFGNV